MTILNRLKALDYYWLFSPTDYSSYGKVVLLTVHYIKTFLEISIKKSVKVKYSKLNKNRIKYLKVYV